MLYSGTLVLQARVQLEQPVSELVVRTGTTLKNSLITVLLIDYVINAHSVLLNPLRRLQLSKRRAAAFSVVFETFKLRVRAARLVLRRTPSAHWPVRYQICDLDNSAPPNDVLCNITIIRIR